MLSTRRLYQINSSRILQHVRLNRGKSRISISEELELDRSTITKVMRQLIECGLVRTTGKYREKPGAGRMATGLEINPGFALVLGIEVQTEFFRTVLVDLDGTILESGQTPYVLERASLADQLLGIIDAERLKAAAHGLPLAGVGIGLSGIVDAYEGIIINSNPLGITEPLGLKEALEGRCPEPVFVENDANCCCWAEMAFRRTTPDRNFMALLGEFRNVDVAADSASGTALGIGIVIRDSVLHGDSFTAGEFRSLKYDHTKPSHSQFSITDEEAARLPDDKEVLARVFSEIAWNVSLLVNCLDITKIVIAGDFARYARELAPMIRDAIDANWLYSTKKDCQVMYSPDEELSVCIGAAGLFIQKLFSVPGMTDHTDEEVGFILLERILPTCARRSLDA